jgi:hypothetical protein
MADYDSAVALKIKSPSENDLADKLNAAARYKNAMDESDRENAARGAFPQTQGAFQPQQGAFGRIMDELSGSKPAY